MEALYGFDSGRSKRAITENRKIAEALKEDKGFVYEVISFSHYLENVINNSISRRFLTRTGSEKGYTTIL